MITSSRYFAASMQQSASKKVAIRYGHCKIYCMPEHLQETLDRIALRPSDAKVQKPQGCVSGGSGQSELLKVTETAEAIRLCIASHCQRPIPTLYSAIGSLRATPVDKAILRKLNRLNNAASFLRHASPGWLSSLEAEVENLCSAGLHAVQLSDWDLNREEQLSTKDCIDTTLPPVPHTQHAMWKSDASVNLSTQAKIIELETGIYEKLDRFQEILQGVMELGTDRSVVPTEARHCSRAGNKSVRSIGVHASPLSKRSAGIQVNPFMYDAAVGSERPRWSEQTPTIRLAHVAGGADIDIKHSITDSESDFDDEDSDSEYSSQFVPDSVVDVASHSENDILLEDCMDRHLEILLDGVHQIVIVTEIVRKEDRRFLVAFDTYGRYYEFGQQELDKIFVRFVPGMNI